MRRPFSNLIQHISTHVIYYKHQNILSSVINRNIRVNEKVREKKIEREREIEKKWKRVDKQHVSFSMTIYFYWWLELINVNKCNFHKKKCYLWCNYAISWNTGTFTTHSIISCNAYIEVQQLLNMWPIANEQLLQSCKLTKI